VSALGKQIEINCIKRDNISTVLVDPDPLTAAIVNLGINARDAMPDGDRPTIDADTGVIDEDGASLREIAAGRYVSIRVEDTVDKAIQNRVFEPFFSTKEVGKGTGLGLSMVYGFAKQSGGHVEFETRSGSGTTFTLYIPATEQRPLPVQRSTSAIPAVTTQFSASRMTQPSENLSRSNFRDWATAQ
jgi:signal transduction histidine kinase